jgi:hypothetical protein
MGERAPRPDDSPWRVTVEGDVQASCSLSLCELESLPQVEQVVDIHCVTRWSKPAVRFRGVPLAALLARAQPTAEARFASFVARSARDHSTSLPLADAVALGALVALSADGAALASERGGPVRLVVPGRYFYKSLKWLERIELLAEDRLGFWESTAGYHNTADPWQQQRYIAGGLSRAELQAVLAARDLSDRNLLGLRAAGFDLQGLRASNALLRDADFSDCKLRDACFDGANLTNARFQRSDLRGASFGGADLEGVDFAGADLRGARLLGVSLLGASFVDDPAAGRGAIIDGSTQFDRQALDHLTPPQQAFLLAALSRGTGAR